MREKKKKGYNPSSRIRTSDLWISMLPLQSTALPTELSKDVVVWVCTAGI